MNFEIGDIIYSTWDFMWWVSIILDIDGKQIDELILYSNFWRPGFQNWFYKTDREYVERL